MKIGVIGYTGMVGSRLVEQGLEPIQTDVTSTDSLKKATRGFDCVIYAAGYTDVDKCQENVAKAFEINTLGVNKLLQVYKNRLVYISSDHVFDGKKNWWGRGYTEKHEPSPPNTYGGTKVGGEFLAKTFVRFTSPRSKGEMMAKIIRTSKLFDLQYVKNKLENNSEFSDKLTRTFLHVDHFVHGVSFVLDNWEKIPIILNISGTNSLTHYKFFLACAEHLNYPEPTARKKLLKNAVPRPIRGGLNVDLAQRLGVPLYSAYDGVKLL